MYCIFNYNFSVARVQFCINLHTISVFGNLQFAYLFTVPQAFMGNFLDFFIFMYVIQQFFICRPSDSTVSGSNQGLLRLCHWQPAALTTQALHTNVEYLLFCMFLLCIPNLHTVSVSRYIHFCIPISYKFNFTVWKVPIFAYLCSLSSVYISVLNIFSFA